MNFGKRRKVIMKRLQCCTKNYFSETSLHGFRYITDAKSSKFKSFFWALVCIISTCLCFILIRSQIRSYYSNRITTTILTTAFPIWEVPFPTVTLCNFNLIYKNSTQQFKDLLSNRATPDEMDNFFSNLSALILSTRMDRDLDWEEYTKVTKLLERAGYNTEKLMRTLMHPCNQMISDCYWNDKEMDCDDLFRPIKTSSGYCCSFNYKGHKYDKADKSTYVSGVGPSFGLYLHLRAEEDQYVSSLKHSLGIDVSIHENKQYPDMSIYSTTIRPGNDVSLSVKPEITESEKNVKDTPINTRGCAFADEIKMEWSNSYSYTTCMNECKAKEIKKLCGCIPYYFYHIRGRSRFCTLPDLACIKRNNVKIKTSKITYNNYLRGILANTFNTQTSDYTTKCKCYPQCDEISYSYQQDQQPLQTSNVGLGSNVSILRVYFGHVSCMKLLRSVLITWELIVASVGGLVGLCLGGSILSVIEFFYHVMEALFSRYTRKLAVAENKKYKPKLYLTDFVRTKNVEAFKVVKCDCRKEN